MDSVIKTAVQKLGNEESSDQHHAYDSGTKASFISAVSPVNTFLCSFKFDNAVPHRRQQMNVVKDSATVINVTTTAQKELKHTWSVHGVNCFSLYFLRRMTSYLVHAHQDKVMNHQQSRHQHWCLRRASLTAAPQILTRNNSPFKKLRGCFSQELTSYSKYLSYAYGSSPIDASWVQYCFTTAFHWVPLGSLVTQLVVHLINLMRR